MPDIDASLTRLCATAEIAPGTVKQVSVPALPDELAVYNLEGEFFVTDDLCTHGMVSLSGGDVDGDQIFCPLHGGAFDIRSGKAVEHPCRIALKTYPAEVIDGAVYARLG